MMLLRCLAVIALLLAAFAATPTKGAGAPDPASLLLAPTDLPLGYVRDDILENADATARSAAYAALVAASAFAGYRTQHAAVVHYVARLHSRADAGTFLAGEAGAVAATHEAVRLTVAAYGDATTLAYQSHGSRGEEWVSLLFANGPYVTVIGAYDATGTGAALATVQALAPIVDTRLRAAASVAPDPTPTTGPPRTIQPALRIVTLATTTRPGRLSDVFRPHSTVYWRIVWQVGNRAIGARETLRERVQSGTSVLYRNSLTDRPYPGANALADQLHLHGAPPGRYTISVTITIGRLSAYAMHSFAVVPLPPRKR